jgi:hypothetical protein
MKKSKNKIVSPSKSSKKTSVTPASSASISSPKTRVSSPDAKRLAITQRLRRGDFAKLSVLTGYDKTHVSKVIRGVSNNPSGEILNTAYKFLGKRKPVTA